LAEPIIYRASVLLAPTNQKLARVGLMLLTLLLVNITWVFFRAPDFGGAARILLAMFGLTPDGRPLLATIDLLKVGVLTVLLVGTHWLMRDTSVRQVAARLPWWLLGLGWGAMLVLLILTQKSSSSFIYFQF
jgi:hypothetical protein